MEKYVLVASLNQYLYITKEYNEATSDIVIYEGSYDECLKKGKAYGMYLVDETKLY